MEKTDYRSGVLPVYIYNSVEDEWQYISCLETIAQQNERILLSNAYADSYLFANAGRKQFFFISPVPISSEFRAYFEQIAHATVTVLNPQMETPFICKNIIKDKQVFNMLVLAARNYHEVALYPYATSKYVYTLKKELEKYGVKVAIPESPEEKNAWTVASFGSKNGFRSLITDMDKKGNLLMPEGKIFSSPSKADQYASELLKTSPAILLKTGKGSGGHGTYIINRTLLDANKEYIKSLLGTNPALWKTNKIVVEQFIETDQSHPVKFPNIEGYVDTQGIYRLLYTCNMLVTPEGNFYGMEVGPEALDGKLEQTMIQLGHEVGQAYAKAGYRGHFDIDMIYGKDGKLYMDESNTRNTGGTDAYKITRYLLGKQQFGQSFILSKFIDLPRSQTPPLFADIMKKLAPILYDPATKTGLILSSEAALKEHSVTYFIIGRTKRQAYELEEKLFTFFHYLKP